MQYFFFSCICGVFGFERRQSYLFFIYPPLFSNLAIILQQTDNAVSIGFSMIAVYKYS